MGFYVRKAISFGPLRFNLSKGGIGVSVGVKGARIGTGPRGAYVHMGRYGLYYRQSLGGARPQNPSSCATPSQPSATETYPSEVGTLVDSSSEEVLARINSHLSRGAVAPYIFISTVLITGLLASIAAVGAVVIGPIGLILTWIAHSNDLKAKTTPVLYELGSDADKKFESIKAACEGLAKAGRIWKVEGEQGTTDWKRSSGASTLIRRSDLDIRKSSAPWISTNVEVWSIGLGNLDLYFFPDRLLVWDSRSYGAVSYDSLTVTFRPQRFIEDETVPNDTEIVDHTWRYVNKDGSPDRRFVGNAQLPVALYGALDLTSKSGLDVLLYVSNRQLASNFAAVFDTGAHNVSVDSIIISRLRSVFSYAVFHVNTDQDGVVHVTWVGAPLINPVRIFLRSLVEKGLVPKFRTQFHHVDDPPDEEPDNKANNHSKPRTRQPDNPQKTAYAVLGVYEGASPEEIRHAYLHMAQMYHPDKVAGLAPEFRALADKRMKEINAAYEELKAK